MQVLNGPLLSVIRLISFYISLIKRTSFNYDNKPYSPSLSLSLSLFDFAHLDERGGGGKGGGFVVVDKRCSDNDVQGQMNGGSGNFVEACTSRFVSPF